MRDEYIWLICISIVIIIGIIANIYKDRFTKWFLFGLYMLHIPAIIYLIYCFLTPDSHHTMLDNVVFSIILIISMYRNRYMVMKESD